MPFRATKPADDHDPVATPPARRGRLGRAERRRIDPARHDRDSLGVPAEPLELVDLVAARRHDVVGVAQDLRFDPGAVARARVGLALVAPLDDPERVEWSGTHGGGSARVRIASRAAHPDIQKWAWTMSGRWAAHRRRNARAKSGM